MKRLTMQSMVAAALVVLAAGSASAQTLKAEIPFAFRVGDTLMAPGTYHVRVAGAQGRYVAIHNAGTKAAVLALFDASDAPKGWQARGTPTMRFECAGARCALRQMWGGFDAPAYNFRGPKLVGEGEMRTAEIRMSVVKAD